MSASRFTDVQEAFSFYRSATREACRSSED